MLEYKLISKDDRLEIKTNFTSTSISLERFKEQHNDGLSHKGFGLLPHNLIYIQNLNPFTISYKDNNTNSLLAIFEESPRYRTISYHPGMRYSDISELDEYNIPLPWIYYIVKSNQYSNRYNISNRYMSNRLYMFYSLERITDLNAENNLIHFTLPNVVTMGDNVNNVYCCLPDDSSFKKVDKILSNEEMISMMQGIITDYWSNVFNDNAPSWVDISSPLIEVEYKNGYSKRGNALIRGIKYLNKLSNLSIEEMLDLDHERTGATFNSVINSVIDSDAFDINSPNFMSEPNSLYKSVSRLLLVNWVPPLTSSIFL